jgi:hypothetical protein
MRRAPGCRPAGGSLGTRSPARTSSPNVGPRPSATSARWPSTVSPKQLNVAKGTGCGLGVPPRWWAGCDAARTHQHRAGASVNPLCTRWRVQGPQHDPCIAWSTWPTLATATCPHPCRVRRVLAVWQAWRRQHRPRGAAEHRPVAGPRHHEPAPSAPGLQLEAWQRHPQRAGDDTTDATVPTMVNPAPTRRGGSFRRNGAPPVPRASLRVWNPNTCGVAGRSAAQRPHW